jgi:cation diffusion facilitator family transporter
MGTNEAGNNNYFKNVKTVLIVTLLLNWAVSIAKIAAGFLANSFSLIADGLHSFSDGLSNITGLIGISIASRPRDDDHPYGHEKFETISALAISLMLVLVSLNIIYSAVLRIIDPVTPEITWVTFLVLIITILVNIFVSRYEFKKGTELKSELLISDSAHTGSDILVSISVLISLISAYMGYPFLDPIASILIAVIIIKVAAQIFLKNTDVLSDHIVIKPEKIEPIIMEVPGVLRCNNIRTRGRKDHIFVDLHIKISGDMTVYKQHELTHDIEDRIKTNIPAVKEVYFHIEPEEE